MYKLRNTQGETLVETLVALLIATLVMLFLATSVVVATNINEKVSGTDISFNYATDTSDAKEITVTLTDKNNKEVGSATANEYTDESGNYTYYKDSESNG